MKNISEKLITYAYTNIDKFKDLYQQLSTEEKRLEYRKVCDRFNNQIEIGYAMIPLLVPNLSMTEITTFLGKEKYLQLEAAKCAIPVFRNWYQSLPKKEQEKKYISADKSWYRFIYMSLITEQEKFSPIEKIDLLMNNDTNYFDIESVGPVLMLDRYINLNDKISLCESGQFTALFNMRKALISSPELTKRVKKRIIKKARSEDNFFAIFESVLESCTFNDQEKLNFYISYHKKNCDGGIFVKDLLKNTNLSQSEKETLLDLKTDKKHTTCLKQKRERRVAILNHLLKDSKLSFDVRKKYFQAESQMDRREFLFPTIITSDLYSLDQKLLLFNEEPYEHVKIAAAQWLQCYI